MSTELTTLTDRAQQLAEYAYSTSTRAKYGDDIRHFNAWCQRQGVQALPASPATIATWLVDHEERYAPATLKRHMAAINSAHLWAGLDPPARMGRHPELGVLWRAILHKHGSAPRHAKPPLLTDQVRAMVAACAGRWRTRNRAMILLAYSGAFRRSEVVGLDISDVQTHAKGLTVLLRRSKTDQEGRGRKVGIPRGADAATCPVAAVQAWIGFRGEWDGPLFPGKDGRSRMTDQNFRLIVKDACAAAGLGPQYSAHSLRSGFVTQAIRGGASDHAVMDQTGHKDPQMVRRYRRETELFLDNAAARLGL